MNFAGVIITMEKKNSGYNVHCDKVVMDSKDLTLVTDVNDCRNSITVKMLVDLSNGPDDDVDIVCKVLRRCCNRLNWLNYDSVLEDIKAETLRLLSDDTHGFYVLGNT